MKETRRPPTTKSDRLVPKSGDLLLLSDKVSLLPATVTRKEGSRMLDQELPRITSWINARPVSHNGQNEIAVIDPATELPIAYVLEADAAEVDMAVKAARYAFNHGPWPRFSTSERAFILRRVADLIDARREELARLESQHTGIPITQIKEVHLPRTSLNFRFFADYITQAQGRSYADQPNVLTYVKRYPIGVAALIAPWNVPLGLGMMKTAAALAFGCTVVLKPSEMTPVTFPIIMEILAQAGVPDGAVNLVNGRGSVTGAALSAHADVDCYSFTGGTSTGRMIAAAAAGRLKPSTMELGGKSAAIVFADCDFDAALMGVHLANFAGNGQQCLNGTRVMIERPLFERFAQALVAKAKAMKIGPPSDPTTQLGPVQNGAHMARILSFVARAQDDGCTILTGGTRASGFTTGFYIDPIIASAPDNDRIICREEIFGPFATLIPFDTPAQAIAMANDNDFGLVGYVWTKDIDKAIGVADQINTGAVWINTSMIRELRAPFGGWKDSGLGRESGDGCAALFTEEKTITIKTKNIG
jgi:acyl-CoA reductase-like NAD-dependent aldehyde dehydrogenase